MAASDDRLWLRRTEAALLCDLYDRTWDSKVRPRLLSSAIRGAGPSLRFYAPAVVRVMRELDAQVQSQANEVDADDDTDEESDGGERGKLARAQLLELELAERLGEVVRIEVIRRALAAGLIALRGAGDRLVRRHGNDAGEIFNEGISEFASAAKSIVSVVAGGIGEPGEQRDLPATQSDGPGEDAAPADDR